MDRSGIRIVEEKSLFLQAWIYYLPLVLLSLFLRSCCSPDVDSAPASSWWALPSSPPVQQIAWWCVGRLFVREIVKLVQVI